MVKKGASLRPLVCLVPASPNNELEKKKKVVRAGKGCGDIGGASELKLGQFGARGGASRSRVSPIPPFDHKCRGHTPFNGFPPRKVQQNKNNHIEI